VEVPQVAATPIFANVPDAEQQQSHAATPAHGSAMPTQSTEADSTLVHRQNLQPIFEQEEDEGLEGEQEGIEHPRLRQTIQWDHPADNILGSLRKGVVGVISLGCLKAPISWQAMRPAIHQVSNGPNN
jgi:hypothetical protein